MEIELTSMNYCPSLPLTNVNLVIKEPLAVNEKLRTVNSSEFSLLRQVIVVYTYQVELIRLK